MFTDRHAWGSWFPVTKRLQCITTVPAKDSDSSLISNSAAKAAFAYLIVCLTSSVFVSYLASAGSDPPARSWPREE